MKEMLNLPNILFILKTSAVIFSGFAVVEARQHRKYKLIKRNMLEENKDYRKWLITESTFEELRSINELVSKINWQKVQAFSYCLGVLVEKTSPSNLKTIYNNLSTLSLETDNAKCGSLEGKYLLTNVIVVRKDTDALALPHEFLHAASSVWDKVKGIWYSGFNQYDTNTGASIGGGLNEGYTELLSSRWYFKGRVTSYRPLVRLTELFEFFFDNPKDMENYYFNHNLPGFINYMEQFSSRKEIIEILLQMDIIRKGNGMGLFVTALDEIKVTLKLYRMFKDNCQDPVKLEQFERKIKRMPLVRLTLLGQKLKLFKDYSYGNTCSAGHKSR